MVMFLALHHMESISLNSSDLQVADFNTRNKSLTQKFLKQGYRYHKHGKHFLNFIADTLIGYLNSMLDLNLSSAEDFRSLSYTVTKCICWRRLLALIFFSAQIIKIISL